MPPIAMALEIGLPWWAITAIALGVAASSAVGFVLFRARFLRGILATLVLEGAVIAAVAPVVMGTSNSSVSAMTAGGERLSAQEFARRADANCRQLAKKPAANFGKPAPTPRFADRLNAFMPEFERALTAQGNLRPPEGEQATATHWMNAMAAVGRDFETMRAAARQSDSKAFGAAGKRLSADAGESAQLSKRLGETYCFQ